MMTILLVWFSWRFIHNGGSWKDWLKWTALVFGAGFLMGFVAIGLGIVDPKTLKFIAFILDGGYLVFLYRRGTKAKEYMTLNLRGNNA